MSQSYLAVYPGHRASIYAQVPDGSHQAVGFPRSLIDLVLRTGTPDSLPVSTRWDPISPSSLFSGQGNIQALNLTVLTVEPGEVVRFGVPDTVSSAQAFALWSGVSSPWNGMPRTLSINSNSLFQPVVFALNSLR